MSSRRQSRGYTAVELMLALAVLTIGSGGIITMQRVTAQSNRHAKALTVATHIAQAWIDQLVSDSSQWQQSGSFANTDWLDDPQSPQHPNTQPGWFRPAYSSTRSWGHAFDLAGNPQVTASRRTVFCTDIRFTWLYAEVGTASQGSGLMRAEVRVYWARTGVAQLAIPLGNSPCAWDPTQVDGAAGLSAYHFVNLSTAILQNERP